MANKDKMASRPGDEADDRWYTDILQVGYTEAMPAIARRVWNKIPAQIRDSMTEEGSLWAIGLPVANALMERGLTKAWGGKYAGMNDFRRDLMAAVNQIRREEAAKNAGGGAKDDDKADAHAPKGGLVGLCVADAAGNYILHYANCPDVPPEKEGKPGKQGKQGQPGSPAIPAVKHRRMTMDEASKLGVPFHDRCKALLEEAAKKAEPAKKKGAQSSADLLAKFPEKAKKIMEFVAHTYTIVEERRRILLAIRLFLNSEAELDLLANAATDKASFDAAVEFIKESNPGARLAFSVTEAVGGFFRRIGGHQPAAAQPGQAAPPAGGTGQQQKPDYGATWKQGVRMFRR